MEQVSEMIDQVLDLPKKEDDEKDEAVSQISQRYS